MSSSFAVSESRTAASSSVPPAAVSRAVSDFALRVRGRGVARRVGFDFADFAASLPDSTDSELPASFPASPLAAERWSFSDEPCSLPESGAPVDGDDADFVSLAGWASEAG